MRRVGIIMLVTIAILSFPMSAFYTVYTGNQQDKHLCQEAQNRYDVIFAIIQQVGKNSSNPHALDQYFDLLGSRPQC